MNISFIDLIKKFILENIQFSILAEMFMILFCSKRSDILSSTTFIFYKFLKLTIDYLCKVLNFLTKLYTTLNLQLHKYVNKINILFFSGNFLFQRIDG